MKLCVAFGSVPLVAVSVTGKDPRLRRRARAAARADDNVRPVGSATPVDAHRRRGEAGHHHRERRAAVFTTNVAVFALVIAGAWLTFNVNACAALGGVLLVAVKVKA